MRAILIFLFTVLIFSNLTGKQLVYETCSKNIHKQVFLVKDDPVYKVYEFYENGVFSGAILAAVGLGLDFTVSYIVEKICKNYSDSEFTCSAIGFLAGGFSGVARKQAIKVIRVLKNSIKPSKTVASIAKKKSANGRDLIDIEVASDSRKTIGHFEKALNAYSLSGVISSGYKDLNKRNVTVSDFSSSNYECYYDRIKALGNSVVNNDWIESYIDGSTNTVLCCEKFGKYCSYKTKCDDTELFVPLAYKEVRPSVGNNVNLKISIFQQGCTAETGPEANVLYRIEVYDLVSLDSKGKNNMIFSRTKLGKDLIKDNNVWECEFSPLNPNYLIVIKGKNNQILHEGEYSSNGINKITLDLVEQEFKSKLILQNLCEGEIVILSIIGFDGMRHNSYTTKPANEKGYTTFEFSRNENKGYYIEGIRTGLKKGSESETITIGKNEDCSDKYMKFATVNCKKKIK